MDQRENRLLAGLALLVALSAVVLSIESLKPGADADAVKEFHRLAGGVGFGPAVDLSGCVFAFDPRLDESCEADCGPVPAGALFCTRHVVASISALPPRP